MYDMWQSKNWDKRSSAMGMSLDERVEQSIQFSLTAFDTPERRERICSDVRRTIGDTKFQHTMTISMDGEPLVQAVWDDDDLVVTIVKPEPVEETSDAEA